MSGPVASLPRELLRLIAAKNAEDSFSRKPRWYSISNWRLVCKAWWKALPLTGLFLNFDRKEVVVERFDNEICAFLSLSNLQASVTSLTLRSPESYRVLDCTLLAGILLKHSLRSLTILDAQDFKESVLPFHKCQLTTLVYKASTYELDAASLCLIPYYWPTLIELVLDLTLIGVNPICLWPSSALRSITFTDVSPHYWNSIRSLYLMPSQLTSLAIPLSAVCAAIASDAAQDCLNGLLYLKLSDTFALEPSQGGATYLSHWLETQQCQLLAIELCLSWDARQMKELLHRSILHVPMVTIDLPISRYGTSGGYSRLLDLISIDPGPFRCRHLRLLSLAFVDKLFVFVQASNIKLTCKDKDVDGDPAVRTIFDPEEKTF